MEAPRRTVTFIVRISRDTAGEVVGSVQRVRTGERRPFRRAESIGHVIVEMIEPGDQDDLAGSPERPRQTPT